MPSEKKPVGFATHLTAGGIAGAMEAVSYALAALPFPRKTLTIFSSHSTHVMLLVMLPASRHNQSANAAFAFGYSARGTYSTTPSHRTRLADMELLLFPPLSLHHMVTDETTRVHRNRRPDCTTRDAAGAL